MIFDFENDNFDDFVRAVCYEILRACNNVLELLDFRNKFLVKFLAHNIGKINTDTTIGEQPIKMIINAIENGISISDMCIFLDNIMTEKEIINKIKDMHFDQRDLIKENSKIETAFILDVSGKVVKILHDEDLYSNKISVKSLPVGLYLLQINSENKSYSAPFVRAN